MRDERLHQIIRDRVSVKPSTLKVVLALLIAFSLGFGVATGIFRFAPDQLTDDDLAKLAELAACSTGQPASAVWLKAKNDAGWFQNYRTEIARQFLVDIDINTCSVRQTANTHTDQFKVLALSPSDAYN